MHTVKPVYNNHPRDQNFVAVVDRWSLTQVWLYLYFMLLFVEKFSRKGQKELELVPGQTKLLTPDLKCTMIVLIYIYDIS